MANLSNKLGTSNRSKRNVKNRSKVKRVAAKRAGVRSKKRKRRAKKAPR
ncbi:MAG: hypothetical protein WCS72_02090 [Deltaproteobacteria bacterium]